jgi:caspase-like apoptosis-related cysteine protease
LFATSSLVTHFCSEPAEAVMPVDKNAEEYNMKHKRRGKAVIFNHYSFNNDNLIRRDGSQVDVEKLEKTYKALDFDVTTYDDLEYNEIRSVINGCKYEKVVKIQVL